MPRATRATPSSGGSTAPAGGGFDQRASPAFLWPCPLAGAGNRDLLAFRDGGGTYDLYRLRWRSSVLHTYATAGTWTSSVIDGNDPTANKAWTRIGATFAAPGDRGNTASVDSVNFPLEYSVDGGVTWSTAVDYARGQRSNPRPHPRDRL